MTGGCAFSRLSLLSGAVSSAATNRSSSRLLIKPLIASSISVDLTRNFSRKLSFLISPNLKMEASPPSTSVDGRPAVRSLSYSADAGKYETITVKKDVEKAVGIIRLNRPKVLNALSAELSKEFLEAAVAMANDDEIRAIVIAGSDRAFAAGADIKMMSKLKFEDVAIKPLFGNWEQFTQLKKPTIAAVNGFALGGGCELAMMCDIIIAGEKAIFGQPEVTIGTIPGMGGTQRLCRSVGKSLAMEMVLTGKPIDAQEALRAGLVSKVVDPAKTEETAIEIAATIAKYSHPIIVSAKQCVNRAYESTLKEGLLYEEQAFKGTFATEDRKEGMTAFVEKRPPNWSHQ